MFECFFSRFSVLVGRFCSTTLPTVCINQEGTRAASLPGLFLLIYSIDSYWASVRGWALWVVEVRHEQGSQGPYFLDGRRTLALNQKELVFLDGVCFVRLFLCCVQMRVSSELEFRWEPNCFLPCVYWTLCPHFSVILCPLATDQAFL